MPNWIKSFGFGLAQKWMLSEKGVIMITAIWAASIGYLGFITPYLEQLAPLSYGIVLWLSVMLGLWFCKLYNSLFSFRFSNKPTFVEYRMEKGRVNLIKKSNIYGEPAFMLGICAIQENQPIIASNARNHKRLENKNPPVFKETDKKSASINVVFDKPIENARFHVRLVKGNGDCPTRVASNINNRTANVDLEDISNDCSFQIWFNEEKAS